MTAPVQQCQPGSVSVLTPAERCEALSDWFDKAPTDLIAFGTGARDVIRPDYILADDADWIIEQLKAASALQARVEEQDKLLAEAADFLNCVRNMGAMDCGAKITAYRLAQLPLEDRK